MPVDPPGPADLDRVSRHYGLGLSHADVASFEPFVGGLLTSWDAVEQPLRRERAAAPDRPWTRPGRRRQPARRLVRDHLDRRGAKTARSPAVSVAIKDNTAVAGVPMMNGSSTLEGYVPARDATVVTRLLDAGATIAGKAVCEDLCFSGGSHTSRTGPVRNPWDTTRSAGGSSSGSAALLAAGVVDIATGGDQGGSVRIPAAYCGVVGHKPTHGLVPYTGAFPIEQTIDHIGPMARTVADVALTLAVLAGRTGWTRVSLPTSASRTTSPSWAGVPAGCGWEWSPRGSAGTTPSRPSTPPCGLRSRRWPGAGMSAEEVSVPWHLHGAGSGMSSPPRARRRRWSTATGTG